MWHKIEKEIAKHTEQGHQFHFVYLSHPRAITNFSWRKPSPDSQTPFHKNVLLTACRDNITRLWSETSLQESMQFYMCGLLDPSQSVVFFFSFLVFFDNF